MAVSPLDEITPMDDICMKRLFNDRPDLAEIVLRAVLGDPEIKVETARTEARFANYGFHDAQLDVLCTGSGVKYDLELQADPARAWPERASFYESVLSTTALAKGADYPDMDRVEVVFVTNGPVPGVKGPLASFEWADRGTGRPLGAPVRITYVDASYNGFGEDTELGRATHDLLCPDPNKMLKPAFVEAMREFKESLKEDKELETYTQRIRREGIEEGKQEGKQENLTDIVTRLVHDKGMSSDAIADLLGLTVDEVRFYAKGVSLSAS